MESNGALQILTQIGFHSEGSQANVYTGGLPPWLEMCDESEKNLVNFGANMNNRAPLAQKGKSKKLNPKRVGAAWAEKRRIELEMEKKGEIVMDSVDDNWLPNFGRVWQAGTRKESRKEFERENHKLFKDGLHSEASFKLQPYISKRMSINLMSVAPTSDSSSCCFHLLLLADSLLCWIQRTAGLP
ncbi:TITAN-like protein [Phalaenopsis equestris]|uniref:TITAN-like protein n=1 Tax=Phalaenopsis equestris TaxID=78828 RepID=UPI0009E33F38|nr:TITAN-like protein [Phalaenopsis equestris]